MNWNALFASLPLTAMLGWLASVAIPYLSALFTRKPSHLTGVITALLSLLDGLAVALAQQGNGHYNFGLAAGQAFLAWLTATGWHSKVLSGTPVEAKLYSLFAKPHAPVAAAAAPPA